MKDNLYFVLLVAVVIGGCTANGALDSWRDVEVARAKHCADVAADQRQTRLLDRMAEIARGQQ